MRLRVPGVSKSVSRSIGLDPPASAQAGRPRQAVYPPPWSDRQSGRSIPGHRPQTRPWADWRVDPYRTRGSREPWVCRERPVRPTAPGRGILPTAPPPSRISKDGPMRAAAERASELFGTPTKVKRWWTGSSRIRLALPVLLGYLAAARHISLLGGGSMAPPARLGRVNHADQQIGQAAAGGAVAPRSSAISAKLNWGSGKGNRPSASSAVAIKW